MKKLTMADRSLSSRRLEGDPASATVVSERANCNEYVRNGSEEEIYVTLGRKGGAPTSNELCTGRVRKGEV
jgi:hypothetical protein